MANDDPRPFIDLSPKVRQLLAVLLSALVILLGGGSFVRAGDAGSKAGDANESARAAESSADEAAAAAQGSCEANNETRGIVLASWSNAVVVIRPFLTDQTPLDELLATQGRLLLPEDCTP